MNLTTISIVVVLAVSVYAATPYSKNRRRDARTVRLQHENACLAAGRCPTCDGAPFEQILMNGLTGCLDCRSTGSARVYLAQR